jgi:ectoine hydroxylase-related dioxygenase (phytanoyl-CoA dioxygenase family)
MTKLAVFDADTVSPDSIGASLDRIGYAVVTGLVGADDLASLRRELAPHIEASRTGETNFLGGRTKRFNNLFMRAPTTRKMILHPLVLAAADHALLPFCSRYQVNYTGVYHVMPGETAQALHRDAFYYPFRNPGIVTVLGTIWAVSDFTAANGGTLVVPGSHLWDEERQPRRSEAVPVAMPAGSALLYLNTIIHGAGANVSNEARTGIGLNLSLGWLRQQENQFLTLPPEVARDLPDALQRLIGYDFGGPFLGAVNGQSPHRLLEEPGGPPGPRNDPTHDKAYRERVRWLRIESVPPPPGVVPTD